MRESWAKMVYSEKHEVSDWGRVRNAETKKVLPTHIRHDLRCVSIHGARYIVRNLVMEHFGVRKNRKKILSRTGSDCIWDLYY